ncbi:MAG: FAD-dependent oxidoreductase [Kosmotogaceae bacterium]
MTELHVLIAGGGPAGLAAAIEAGKAGLNVLIVDEGIEPGGQLVKQTHKFFGNENFYASVRGFEIAQELLKEISDMKNVEVFPESTVIGIYDKGVPVLHRETDRVDLLKPERIVIATGASEKFLQFENNDLPGVYGAGAVQTLMNQYGILPGENILMIGSGNIGLIVSYQLEQAGANVKAIVEAADRIGGYEVHARKTKRLGIPILLKHTIKKALGNTQVEGAVITEVDENWQMIPSKEREFVVDTICLATGLTPSVELVSQAGGNIKYIPELGGYVPERNIDMRTTVNNVFVAGDVSGIEEATTAMIEGRIAGLNIARDLSKKIDENRLNDLKEQIKNFRSGPTSQKVRSGLQKLGFTTEGEKFVEKNDDNFKKYEGKKRPIIECPEPIPCNPCETSCPVGAITVGENINSIPTIDYEKCTGCGICASKCPGLAIFMLQELPDSNKAIIGIPYEFLPLPQKNETVYVLSRDGGILDTGEVTQVTDFGNKSPVVYVKIDREHIKDARHIKPVTHSRNDYVCRCEEITVEDIEKAIDEGYTDFEELRRYLRIAMGPCGGRTCRLNALKILSRKTGVPVEKLDPGNLRPPAVPTTFKAISEGSEKDE